MSKYLFFYLHHTGMCLNLTRLIQTVSRLFLLCAQSHVLPAPGDLLRREGPGLLAVRLGVAERLYDDFSTLHSGETTCSGSLLHLLTFLYQQTCSFFSKQS